MFESLIVCAKIVVFPQGQCEEGPFDVVIERGLIAAIDRCKGECGNDKLTCHYLTPGFIDIHNHGMGRGNSNFEHCFDNFPKRLDNTCNIK